MSRAKLAGADPAAIFLRIDAFKGQYEFLSNDYPSEVVFDRVPFKSATHAILAVRFSGKAAEICECETAAEAMDRVKDAQERDDWESGRLKWMEQILRDKFRRSAELRTKLKETGGRLLVWANASDAFFGEVDGRGQNQLGRILMRIRTDIRNDTELETWLALCHDLEEDNNARPLLQLIETKPDHENPLGEHALDGEPYFFLGKNPETCQVVALHPSISRTHALIALTKAGPVLMDLNSKAGTKLNGERLPHHHVGFPLKTSDTITLGASTRSYQVKVDSGRVVAYLESRQKELRREVQMLDRKMQDPLAAVKDETKQEATIFVGNLPFTTTKDEITAFFEECGHITEVRFPPPRDKPSDGTTAARGIAFITFDTPLAAKRATGMDGKHIGGEAGPDGKMKGGRRMKVDMSEGPRPSRQRPPDARDTDRRRDRDRDRDDGRPALHNGRSVRDAPRGDDRGQRREPREEPPRRDHQDRREGDRRDDRPPPQPRKESRSRSRSPLFKRRAVRDRSESAGRQRRRGGDEVDSEKEMRRDRPGRKGSVSRSRSSSRSRDSRSPKRGGVARGAG
ncbi:unnamed protein product [Vitrella brassicaformis CCMP3155]|uniref:FHA domain-containing protein n=2 Tax=Vitrella brassicaformis TaxID=1169539 RepID=A0A0G4EG70_VITBC|nr:unnamed protein product [Vitrella brassicaformis CCMP3155]|mmetsp:Transcript_24101/g.69552  ORF Transcript_24101/g.69552 Transcript_24101/m.69552 type:complete len:570 (-) Transcript_24101:313-2022(-)|eukprot:CEL94448.1 unnamed protein product [Vitrella brassicaformis CCMP3155]